MVSAQHGDQRAFEALTVADQPRLFKLAYGVLRDRPLAEDASQQACLDIWRHLPRLRDDERFEAWSYRLLVHACYAEAGRNPRWLSDERFLQTDVIRAPDAYHEVLDRDALERGFERLTHPSGRPCQRSASDPTAGERPISTRGRAGKGRASRVRSP